MGRLNTIFGGAERLGTRGGNGLGFNQQRPGPAFGACLEGGHVPERDSRNPLKLSNLRLRQRTTGSDRTWEESLAENAYTFPARECGSGGAVPEL